ncbi:hypothetical protein O181_085284 [Austropuccinia psidii MF-1]|uniref:Tc1-like transposase DDE domain-containing protein n=1 Tax=Austropuccinia psidii MF-1 TaxID=1389203 RepID=A0A9Q3FUZ7_9BASI|nr:hypothetical protein [Austropuccinia psidii MF-1]
MILESGHVLPPRGITFANWTSIKDSPLPSGLVIGIFNHGLASFGLMNRPSNWARRLIRPTCFLDGTQTAEIFIQQVYEPHLQRFYSYMVNAPYIQTCDHIAMMEAGAPIHTAQISNEWQAIDQIDKLPWPAHSPDLNPIENVWKVLNTWVTKHHQPHTMDKLRVAIQSAWDDLSPAFFKKLLIGMQKVIGGSG